MRVALLLLSTGILPAQVDLTGEWRLVAEKSNFARQPAPQAKLLQVDHREPTLRITILERMANGAVEGTAFYSTDGVERSNLVLGNTIKSSTTWDGKALRMRSSGKFGNTDITLDDRYEVAPDGQTLTLRRHFEGTGPNGALPAQDQVLVHERIPLRAGLARVEITPKAMMPMYGYANRRCGPANGVHDPLWAKVLILESAQARLAIVTLDLGSLVSEVLRDRITKELGVDLLLLASSHTHSAPFFLPPTVTPTSALGTEPKEAAEYRAELEQKIFGAVKQATSSLFPARLRTGSGSARLGYNRLLKREHGRARALFDNLERIPYGPVDPEFNMLEVTDGDGNAKALLVHYGVHSVVLGSTNCKYSADYPGAMQEAVEKALPSIQAMFVQGGAGDINPVFQGRSGNETNDFALVSRLGALLASEVLKARSGLRRVEPASQPIRVRSELLTVGDRWTKGKSHTIGISTALIGRDIAIAAMPGEPHHLLQKTWKERADAAFPLFYGYTFSAGGEWPGYLPDLRTAAYGGYGADSTATTVEIGAGERILERHLYHLYDLKGMWLPAPGLP